MKSDESAPRLSDIQRYCRSIDADQAALVSRFHCALIPTDVAAAWPILHAVLGSGPLRALEFGSRPLASALGASAGDFQKQLSAAAAGCEWLCGSRITAQANALSPDLDSVLKDAVLEVRATDGGVGTIQFTILHSRTLAFPRVAADGALTYEPDQPELAIVLQWLPIRFARETD